MPGAGERESESRLYGDVSFGDLLRALAKTTVGNPQLCRKWAVEMLGLPLPARAPVKPDQPTPEVGVDLPQPQTSAPEEPEHPTSVAPIAQTPNRPLEYELVRSKRFEGNEEAIVWLDDAQDLPAVSATQISARPALKSLFHPRTTRALLSTALATPRGEGDIDIDKILDQLTRLRPLDSLPRVPLSTLRLGIQLLIDRGPGTWPYYGDQERIHSEILDVAGRDRVETLYFADSPLRGSGPGSRRTWSKLYQPPAAGTPVVVLTDLGLVGRRLPGSGAPPQEWAHFAERLRDARCPVLAFVPYGPERWPQILRSRMYILQWDRRTNVSMVRRLVGDGLERAATT